MSKEKEYIVTLDAEFHGCTIVVNARSRDDAIERVSKGQIGDIDISGAYLVNWLPRKAELSE